MFADSSHRCAETLRVAGLAWPGWRATNVGSARAARAPTSGRDPRSCWSHGACSGRRERYRVVGDPVDRRGVLRDTGERPEHNPRIETRTARRELTGSTDDAGPRGPGLSETGRAGEKLVATASAAAYARSVVLASAKNATPNWSPTRIVFFERFPKETRAVQPVLPMVRLATPKLKTGTLPSFAVSFQFSPVAENAGATRSPATTMVAPRAPTIRRSAPARVVAWVLLRSME